MNKNQFRFKFLRKKVIIVPYKRTINLKKQVQNLPKINKRELCDPI